MRWNLIGMTFIKWFSVCVCVSVRRVYQFWYQYNYGSFWASIPKLATFTPYGIIPNFMQMMILLSITNKINRSKWSHIFILFCKRQVNLTYSNAHTHTKSNKMTTTSTIRHQFSYWYVVLACWHVLLNLFSSRVYFLAIWWTNDDTHTHTYAFEIYGRHFLK